MSKVWVFQGDALSVLQSFPDESIHCCVTSPPYFGLRDYGTATWEGGNLECDHVERAAAAVGRANGLGHGASSPTRHSLPLDSAAFRSQEKQFRGTCRKCGAVRTDKQIGLEDNYPDYIEKLVMIFREVWRVLRIDGTVWLNIGDCYTSGNRGYRTSDKRYSGRAAMSSRPVTPRGLKEKNLIGIPWKVAFALQEDGWILRSDIIWAKGNPMPESVNDRPTRSHEYVFLFTKQPRYYYDKEAVREPAVSNATGKAASFKRENSKRGEPIPGQSVGTHRPDRKEGQPTRWRNRRSVWEVNPRPFKGAHFAVFPTALVEPCLLAGTSEHGCCGFCGTPYKRIVKPTTEYAQHLGKDWANYEQDEAEGRGHFQREDGTRSSQRCVKRNAPSLTASYETVGWEPGCQCEEETVPCTVLDPFAGSGTVGEVALKHGRNAVLIELNPSYIDLIEERVGKENIQCRTEEPSPSSNCSSSLPS